MIEKDNQKEDIEDKKLEVDNHVTQQQVEEISEQKIEDKNREVKNLKSQILRLKAEFDNYRKRVEKEKQLNYKYGRQSIILKLIELTDIIDSAVRHICQANNIKEIQNGMEIFRKEFYSFLAKEGVVKIKGEGKFNPDLHEIVGYDERDDIEENVIISEVQSGFQYENDVLRPARVIISKKKESKKEEETSKQ